MHGVRFPDRQKPPVAAAAGKAAETPVAAAKTEEPQKSVTQAAPAVKEAAKAEAAKQEPAAQPPVKADAAKEAPQAAQ